MTAESQRCRIDQAVGTAVESICLECNVDHCINCAVNGQDGCDICKEGYYLEKTEAGTSCLEGTCRIELCEVCETKGPKYCDKCADNFAVDLNTGLCYSLICNVEHCK